MMKIQYFLLNKSNRKPVFETFLFILLKVRVDLMFIVKFFVSFNPF